MVQARIEIAPYDGKGDFQVWCLKMKAVLSQHKVLVALEEETTKWSEDEKKRKSEIEVEAYNLLILSLGDSIIRKETDSVNFPSLYGQLQPHAVASSQPQHPRPFHSQQAGVTSPNQPAVRPRARRGQATDPHSIAERLRRERITDRVKALQELVPSVNKTDRATMVDEIVDYVKFLRLQVKVLSMSRLGGTGSGVQLVSDEGASNEGRTSQSAWEKWSADGVEHKVAELMGKDVGEAMQFLQSKGLCVVPISLASSMFQTINSAVLLKSESNAPS